MYTTTISLKIDVMIYLQYVFILTLYCRYTVLLSDEISMYVWIYEAGICLLSFLNP